MCSVNTCLHIRTAIIDIAHGCRSGSHSGRNSRNIASQTAMVPIPCTEAYNSDLIAGRNTVFIQDAGHELINGCLCIGAAFAVHAVGAVDAQHDMSGSYRFDLHQIGGGDGHGHIEIVAACMSGRLHDGHHTVLRRYERALLDDFTVLCERCGIRRVLYTAQKHAEKQQSGKDALEGVGAIHIKYLRKT